MIGNVFAKKTPKAKMTSYQVNENGTRSVTLGKGNRHAVAVLDIAESATPESGDISFRDGVTQVTYKGYGDIGKTAASKFSEYLEGQAEPLGDVSISLKQYERTDETPLGGVARFAEKAAVSVASKFLGPIGVGLGVTVADVFSTAAGDGDKQKMKDRQVTNIAKLQMAHELVSSGDMNKAVDARDKWVSTWEEKNGTLSPAARESVAAITVSNSSNGTLTVL